MIIALHTVAGISATSSALAASLSTSVASGSGVGNGPYTTNAVTVTAYGGVSPYTYAWTKVSGDTLTITSASTYSVAWTASGTAPSSKAAVWKCTVTDSAGNSTDTSNVSVSVAFQLSAMSASLSTNSLSGSRTSNGSITTSSVVVSASGGAGGYTYAWTKVSGTTLTLSGSTSATTTFSYTGTAPSTITASYQCVVTDSLSNPVNAGSVSISLTYSLAALALSVTPVLASGTIQGSGVVTTGSVATTASGGLSPYTYIWTRTSGDANTSANSPTSSSTTFSRTGAPTNTYTSYWKCTVTDSLTPTPNTADCSPVTVTTTYNATALSATVAPTSLSGSGINPPTNIYTTDYAVCTPTGGVSPYTYAWEFVNGDGNISAQYSSNATTQFYAYFPSDGTKSGTWRCKVTDSASTVAYSNNVDLFFDCFTY